MDDRNGDDSERKKGRITCRTPFTNQLFQKSLDTHCSKTLFGVAPYHVRSWRCVWWPVSWQRGLRSAVGGLVYVVPFLERPSFPTHSTRCQDGRIGRTEAICSFFVYRTWLLVNHKIAKNGLLPSGIVSAFEIAPFGTQAIHRGCSLGLFLGR